MELSTLLAILAIIFFIFGTVVFFVQKKPTADELLDALKEPLLMLFLYAEKKGWSGPDKMEYCIKEVLKYVPIKIDEATLREIAQKLYDKYSDFIKEMLESEEKEV